MLNWLKGLSIAVVCVLSISAQAGSIIDIENVNTTVKLGNNTVAWTHDLSDTDFVLGTAESANLVIEFKNGASFLDWATIIVGTIDFLDGEFVYKPIANWDGTLGLSSLASLNALGELQVSVSTLFGNFSVGTSTL